MVHVTKKEKLQNSGTESTLNGGINSVVTTITVDDGSVFPATGQNYRCLIDAELVHVTARSTNDLTVERGIEGTTAASHSSGATIKAVVTAGALKQMMTEANPFYREAQTPTLLRDINHVTLTSSDFTWDNQGTSTVVDDVVGNITIKAPDGAGSHSLRLLHKTAETAPWLYRAFILVGPGYEGSTHDGTRFGLCVRESDTGKIFAVEFSPNRGDYTAAAASQAGQLRIMQYTNSTTLGSEVLQEDFFGDRLWLEIENDDTDLFFRVSVDDETYYEIHTEAKGTYMTSAGADEIGFYINPYNTHADVGTEDAWLHLLTWYEE